MSVELLDHLECKFCAGKLRLDQSQRARIPGFKYFRCENCDMPNVFAMPSIRFIAPSEA